MYLLPKKETVLPKGRHRCHETSRDCIECLCCVSVCPAVDVTTFLGPTAMRQEMRLVLDPRDSGDRIATRDQTDSSPAQLPGLLEGLPEEDRDPGKGDRETQGTREQEGAHPAPSPGSGGTHQGDRTEYSQDHGIVP